MSHKDLEGKFISASEDPEENKSLFIISETPDGKKKLHMLYDGQLSDFSHLIIDHTKLSVVYLKTKFNYPYILIQNLARITVYQLELKDNIYLPIEYHDFPLANGFSGLIHSCTTFDIDH